MNSPQSGGQPNPPERIALIGMRGSGKSSVGQALASHYSSTCVDLDERITAEAGCSIADIFSREGESGFRERESALLIAMLGEPVVLPPTVCSLGGGVILRDDNRRRLRDRSIVVWLDASVPTLWQRIQSDPASGANRPALTGLEGEEELSAVLAAREPLYLASCHIRVTTDGCSVESVAALIAERIRSADGMSS
ncbi:MAG: shikimate kinase [Phycisphaerae bacterium]